jgi:hypothetical protein
VAVTIAYGTGYYWKVVTDGKILLNLRFEKKGAVL